MASLEASGFSTEQAAAIVSVLQAALVNAGNEATQNLSAGHRAMNDLASSMASQQAEIVASLAEYNREKDETKTHMERFHAEAEEIKKAMDQHAGAFGKVGESIAQMKSEKETIVADIESKVGIVEGLIQTLNEASSRAFQALQKSYGGIEDELTRHAAKVESQFAVAARAVDLIEGRLGRSENGN